MGGGKKSNNYWSL